MQCIYSSHHGNGAQAMFTSYYYLKIRKPHCRNEVEDMLGQGRHKSKKSENLGQCGRQNMLRPYLKIWDWEWIFGRAVKVISSPGIRSLC